MRFDEFALRVPGEDFRIRFHEHLTVLNGVGGLERQALVDAIVAGLTGGDPAAETTTITGTDHTGRPLAITAERGRVSARFTDEDVPAPTPIGWLVADADELRSIVVVTADDLGPGPSVEDRDDDPPELVEAKATLRALAADLAEATEGQKRVQAVQAELAKLDARIRAAEGDAARREYAKVLADLERVRAEAAALQSGVHGAETDRQLVANADDARRLAARWVELAAATAAARRACEGDEALDPADVAKVVHAPEAAPADLPAIVAALTRAQDHVEALEERLRVVASASLPEPDDERVLALATVDQHELWSSHERLVEASALVTEERVAVGGIGADVERAEAIEELEDAHAAAERANEVIDERLVPVVGGAALTALIGLLLTGISPFVPLVLCAVAIAGAYVGIGGPWRARAQAERRESNALARVGVPSYLGFHLRRVDATLDPTTLDRLGVAEAEAAAAERAWAAVAGGVPVADAAALRAEVEAYANAMASQHGAVQEVAELRRTLDELALPDLAGARERLVLAVEGYGLGPDDVEGLEPQLVLDFVERQVALGRVARRQRALEEAEADEEKVAARLDDVLARLGFADGALEARVGALEWAVERAREREAARAAARPRDEVEADLHRLNAEVRRLRRPEWTEVTAVEAHGPGVEELTAMRTELESELAAARAAARTASGVDVDKLTDRHAAVERRVASLEVQLRGERGDDADVEQLQHYLCAAMTRANCVGPSGEPVPVLFDDTFSRVPAERKWELMDMLRRLSEKTQVLYLTDDAFIGAWARQKADDGAISLLEPVE